MLGALPPVFAGLDPRDADEASSFLQYVGLQAGEVLMEQGEEDLTMAFVTKGAVQLQVDGVSVGNVGSREMLGELELFGQIPRVGSAFASGPVHLAVLAYEHYLQLCQQGNAAAFNLERFAIRRVSDRLRWLHDGILERGRGIAFDFDNQRTPGILQRLFRTKPPPVDPAGVITASPLFDWADTSVLYTLASDFSIRQFPPGTVVARAGEVADDMYVIADGRVDMVLATGPASAEMIATLGPGQAVGESTLAQHTPRSATFVCRDEVIALHLDRATYGGLFATNDPVGSTFRQGVLRNMIALLLASQRRFVELETQRSMHAEQSFRGTPLNSVWRD